MHHSLILFGFKGVGKTYLGKKLAEELGFDFVDTDDLIEKHYQRQFNDQLTCREVGNKLGMTGFRDLEKAIINQLKKKNGRIIALGGGAVLDQENRGKLSQLGKLIYLEGNKEQIKERIFLQGIPAFLDKEDPHDSFEIVYEERKSLYLKASDFIINLIGKTDRQILDELICLLSLLRRCQH